jgi:DNA-binding MurR/RpiR family transcriptional regulator
MRRRILNERQKYSKQVIKVLAVALSTPDIVAFSTVKSVADMCGVSPGTVLRALRTLDFESFAKFKKPFQDVLRTDEGLGDRSLRTGRRRNCAPPNIRSV